MAIKFYLHSISDGNEIHCDTNSSFTEVAGSFNVGNLDIAWNQTDHAIFPNTPFFIVDTSTSPNEIWSFIVSQDNVEVVRKTNPVKYIHHLTVVQRTHRLNFHKLRNTMFSQAYNQQKEIYGCFMFGLFATYDQNYERTQIDESVTFARHLTDTFLKKRYSTTFDFSKLKMKGAKVKISRSAGYYREFDGVEFDDFVEIPAFVISEFSFDIVDANNTSQYQTINVTDNEFYLDDTIINWMDGRQVFLRPRLLKPDASYFTTTCHYVDGVAIPNIVGYIQIKIEQIRSYYYSLWDVLDIINKQYIKHYRGQHLPNLYEMPSKSTEHGALLDSIPAPEFSFTDNTVFEAVAQVMSYIDAFPVLDENNTLDFIYLNDLSNEKINDLIVADKKISFNEENFSNRLIATYQHGKDTNAISYPSNNLFKRPTTDKYGVVERNDYYMQLDLPIDYIDKVIIKPDTQPTMDIQLMLLRGDDPVPYGPNYKAFPCYDLNDGIDMSVAVYRDEIYANLPKYYANKDFPDQNNTLYYTKGDNKIYLGITGSINASGTDEDVYLYAVQWARLYYYGLDWANRNEFYGFPSDKREIKFKVIYHALYNGRTIQESTINKYEGETASTQTNNEVQINRMGNAMQGLVARLGNEARTFTMPITSLGSKVKLGSIWQDSSKNNWIVNRIKTTFTTREDKVIVEASLTKNFNALSQFTKINQEKRFYEIDRNITTKGYENISEFLYFTNRDVNTTYLADAQTAFTDFALNDLLTNTFKALTQVNSRKFDICYLRRSSTTNIYLPTHVYGFGNSICFEMGFDDPLNAGKKTISESHGSGSGAITRIITKPVIYTQDSNGFLDTFEIQCRPRTLSMVAASANFPEFSSEEDIGADTDSDHIYLYLTDFRYYKKPNEILHLNYSISFMPYWKREIDALGTKNYIYDEIFFGDKLLEDNPMIPNKDFYRPLKLYGRNVKCSFLENQIDSTFIDLGYLITGVSITNGDTITFSNTNISQYASWCIADENGNILIAVNNSEDSFTIPKLKFFKCRNRKV